MFQVIVELWSHFLCSRYLYCYIIEKYSAVFLLLRKIRVRQMKELLKEETGCFCV